MILSILLVDDESLARSHIREHFPWRQWGYDIVGEAANGVEALSFCETAAPDIALIDITMPVMDGLTLLEKLKATHPDLRVVIMTAHRDFRFAQRALQKGAAGYILKSSFNMEETKEAMDRVRDEIVKQRTIGENLKSQQQVIQNYRYPIRRQFFEDMLTGLLSGQTEILQKALSIGIAIKADSYIMLVCTVDKLASFLARYREEDHSLIQFSFLEIIREVLLAYFDDGYDIFPASFGRCVILLKRQSTDPDWTAMEASKLIDELNDTLGELMHIAVSVAVSEPFPAIRQVKDKYKALIRYNEHRYYKKKPMAIIEGHLVPFYKSFPAEYGSLFDKFGAAVQSEDRERFDRWLAQASHTSLHFKPEPDLVRQWLASLRQEAERHSDGDLIPDWPPFRHSVSIYESLEQLRDWVTGWWDMRAKLVRTRPEIAKAIQYIKQHMETDFSLEQVAEVVELTPAYLGRIFKRDMGVSMIDYIMEQRIQLAKKHLADGTYRNYELAEKVGFKSYSYFCTIFKKVTGLTPNEYKNNNVPIHSDKKPL